MGTQTLTCSCQTVASRCRVSTEQDDIMKKLITAVFCLVVLAASVAQAEDGSTRLRDFHQNLQQDLQSTSGPVAATEL